MIPAQGAQAAVVLIVAVLQVDPGPPADLPRHIADAGQGPGGGPHHGGQIDSLQHHGVQHPQGVEPLPAPALQNQTALRQLRPGLAGGKLLQAAVDLGLLGMDMGWIPVDTAIFHRGNAPFAGSGQL